MTGSSLHGNTIVLTRPECRSTVLKDRLEELGATVLAIPSIRFLPVEDTTPWQRALENRSRFSHIIFSSITAVAPFLGLCSREGIRLDSWPPDCTFCATGTATAAALGLGAAPTCGFQRGVAAAGCAGPCRVTARL